MAEKSWGDILRDHAPDLDEQNRADRDFLGRPSALSAREKYLLALVLDSAANKPAGARSYGEKAVKAVHASELPAAMLEVIDNAPRYAEGRGVRFVVRSAKDVRNIEKVAIIKMAN